MLVLFNVVFRAKDHDFSPSQSHSMHQHSVLLLNFSDMVLCLKHSLLNPRSVFVSSCFLTIAHSDRLPPWPLSHHWELSKSGPCQQIQSCQY